MLPKLFMPKGGRRPVTGRTHEAMHGCVFQAVGMKSSMGPNIGSGSSGFLGKYCVEQQPLICIY